MADGIAINTQRPNPSIMRTPRSVALDITSLCNLRCLYCYYFGSPAAVRQDLSTDEWLTFFDELGQCAIMQVVLVNLAIQIVTLDLAQIVVVAIAVPRLLGVLPVTAAQAVVRPALPLEAPTCKKAFSTSNYRA